MRELLDQRFERHAILQTQANARRKYVHHPAHGRAFLRHRDEDLAGQATVIQSNRDIPLVTGDIKLVRNAGSRRSQAVSVRGAFGLFELFDGNARRVEGLLFAGGNRLDLAVGRVERLGALRAIAINRDRLEA